MKINQAYTLVGSWRTILRITTLLACKMMESEKREIKKGEMGKQLKVTGMPCEGRGRTMMVHVFDRTTELSAI